MNSKSFEELLTWPKNLVFIFTRCEEEIKVETLLMNFTITYLMRIRYCIQIADFAIELGYKPKQESISKI